jgi:hypothetical protein
MGKVGYVAHSEQNGTILPRKLSSCSTTVGLPYADTFASVKPTIHNLDQNTLLLRKDYPRMAQEDGYMGTFPFYTWGVRIACCTPTLIIFR